MRITYVFMHSAYVSKKLFCADTMVAHRTCAFYFRRVMFEIAYLFKDFLTSCITTLSIAPNCVRWAPNFWHETYKKESNTLFLTIVLLNCTPRTRF